MCCAFLPPPPSPGTPFALPPKTFVFIESLFGGRAQAAGGYL